VLVIYEGAARITYFQFYRTPSGCIPRSTARLYFIVADSLPPGTSSSGPTESMRRAVGKNPDVGPRGQFIRLSFAGFDAQP